MADLLIGPLLSMVKDRASSYLLDQYKVMQGMKEQREILNRRLPVIKDVVDIVEAKDTCRPGVRAWLKELKKVSYEAIEVFDEFKYEALRRDAKKKGHYIKFGMDIVSLFPSHNPIIFRYRMGKKLRKIVKKIEDLGKEMSDFIGFIHGHQEPPSFQWRQVVFDVFDSEENTIVIPREEEKKKIVKILLGNSVTMDLTVLPIVGMGGLGKTTLSQLVYNDPEIREHFQLMRWCCVSDDFDVGRIANDICMSTEKDLAKALEDLRKEISGKRYFIVLDDIWNRDPDKWEKLKTCLQFGGNGSAILITTRHAQVAAITGTTEPFFMEPVGNLHLKKIIENRAFSLQKPSSEEFHGFVAELVDRCAGSVLAAKALGSILSTKTSVQEWKDILAKIDTLNEDAGVLPLLKLCYDDMPVHMKQCFAFCAIFPKDYDIDVDTLVQLWMANDLLPMQQGVDPEKVGNGIFNELALRSFFQDVKQTKLPYTETQHLRNRTMCKIHDLMHDIALSIMEDKCLHITDVSSYIYLSINHPIHHLYLSGNKIRTDFNKFLKTQSQNLKTLLCPGRYTGDLAPHLSKCNSLRALHTFEIRKLQVKPRQLKNLRYLNLSGNSLVNELPEEITILYNLHTLDLSGCINICQLPRGMKYMINLRHLYTNGCKSLRCMPPDLRHLIFLQTLTYFVVGASPDCSTVGELQHLDIGGELELHGLENITECHEVEASLRNKNKLTHLSLEWTSDCHVKEPDHQKKVLDALQPPFGLQMLRIVSNKSTDLPKWMINFHVLRHLTELHLVGFTTCKELQLSYLYALQVLYLMSMDKLQTLCCGQASKTLKEVKLHDLEILETWVATEGRQGEEAAFPLLDKVDIKNCPNLKTLPDAPNLQVLELDEDRAQLSLSILKSRCMSSLSKLILCVSDTTDATLQLDQNHKASISEMHLSGCGFFFPSCPSQLTFGIWKWFDRIEELSIYSCTALVHWPEEDFQYLVSLKNLKVQGCDKLIGRPTQVEREPTQASDQFLPDLHILNIVDCSSLTELFVLPPSLRYVSITSCPSLEYIWGKENAELESAHLKHLGTCASLEHCNDQSSTSVLDQSPPARNNWLPCLDLTIKRCRTLVSLPNLPPNLNRLEISYCENLLSMSGQLDTLTDLSISSCSRLKSLDCLGDMPSLQVIDLRSCKHLASLPFCLDTDYSSLRKITVKYCPVINIKPLSERLQSSRRLEEQDISDAHSSDPDEGPKWRHPKSWKYAMPRF